jgi:hypothetical protein
MEEVSTNNKGAASTTDLVVLLTRAVMVSDLLITNRCGTAHQQVGLSGKKWCCEVFSIS